MPRILRYLLPLLLTAPALAQPQGVPAPDGWADDPPSLTALVAFDHTESDLRTAVRRYLADEAAIERRYPVDYSPVRRERLQRFREGWQGRLAELDLSTLNPEGRVDWVALRNRIDYGLAALALEAERWDEIAPLVPFADGIRLLEEERLDRTRVDPRTAAQTIDGLAEQVTDLTGKLAERDDGTPELTASPVVATRASRHVRHLARVLDEYDTFYDGYDPIYSWWVREPRGRLAAALDDYATALDRELAGLVDGEIPPIIGDPVLADGLQADLALAMIPYSPDELIAIGQAEFDWIVAEFLEVAADMGYGDDWKAALEHTKSLAPPPGEKPWAIFEIADYSEAFLEDLGEITQPPLAREVWRLAMQTPERQLVNPFFTGGEETRVSYPTDGMTHADKLMSMRGNTPHFNFATVHHELIPGHHLQMFMGERFNNHRDAMGWNPFWGEGWALYWELQLWDRGFPRNDPDKIGMLFWRLHRAARIVFSLNYQLGRWSPQQAVDFLVDEVGHERANAEAEVRRTARAHPLYQIAYLIGGLQFRALHGELVETGQMTATDFHDAVMQGGPMPVELVRARLTGQELGPGFTSSWRFYDLPGGE